MGFQTCSIIPCSRYARWPTPWRVEFCEKMLEWAGIHGSAKLAASKELYRGDQRVVERLKWLSQILKKRARQPEICGFESFGEALIHESQGMPGLIALAVVGEQAGQRNRRP
jgi:hypothetical protein